MGGGGAVDHRALDITHQERQKPSTRSFRSHFYCLTGRRDSSTSMEEERLQSRWPSYNLDLSLLLLAPLVSATLIGGARQVPRGLLWLEGWKPPGLLFNQFHIFSFYLNIKIK